MAGHRGYCRFQNNRVSCYHSGFGFIKEYSTGSGVSARGIELRAQNSLEHESRKAAEKFMQDEPVNTMGIYWPK